MTPSPGPVAYAAAAPAAPVSHGQPVGCPRCGSDSIMANVQLTVVGGGAVVMLTPGGVRAVLTASVCGRCGLVQLCADSPNLLWAAARTP